MALVIDDTSNGTIKHFSILKRKEIMYLAQFLLWKEDTKDTKVRLKDIS